MQFHRLKLREFITLLGSAAAWPLAARAAVGKAADHRVSGWGHGFSLEAMGDAFIQRLRELGWIEGRSVAIEYRWAEGSDERATEIATEFHPAQGRCHCHVRRRTPRSKASDNDHTDCLRIGERDAPAITSIRFCVAPSRPTSLSSSQPSSILSSSRHRQGVWRRNSAASIGPRR